MGASNLDTLNAEAQQVRLEVAHNLVERRSHDSDRTVWGEVVARGYDMRQLLVALTSSAHERVPDAVAAVWGQTWHRGTPQGCSP
jgi:hypothetical protein